MRQQARVSKGNKAHPMRQGPMQGFWFGLQAKGVDRKHGCMRHYGWAKGQEAQADAHEREEEDPSP